MDQQQFTLNRLRRWWPVSLMLGLALLLVIVVLFPWNIAGLSSHPRPAQTYSEALQRAETMRSSEQSAMNPACQLQLMTHGRTVERAIILVHGYTNCPAQFQQLGQRFFDLGYNVLIAPLPHHGLADRMTEDHAGLSAEELAAYADETVDIAQGLGQHVTMLGISAGGAITAWAAQNRADIDLAVIISPAFGFQQIPTPLTAAAMNAYTLLPNSFVWWDPVLQAEAPPPHAYPRYSTRALVQTLRLGFATRALADRTRPAAQRIVVVFNANDTAVNNDLTSVVVEIWRAKAAALSTFEFAVELNLGHDLIDPTQPDQQIELVYPRLIELVNQ